MIAEADILKMTKAERLEAINMIWDTLDDDIEPPAWHKEVLEERMREIEAGKATYYTLDELTARLNALRDERANLQ
jgi:putative addiction module component (TIGR02574 family)